MSSRATKIVEAHSRQLIDAVNDNPYVVFLCGPALSNFNDVGSRLRMRILQALNLLNFEVFLGEDDGLENARINTGLNAQDNELEFIKNHCDAVVIVAGSPGSFCELGLFSWHISRPDHFLKTRRKSIDCILLVDEKFKGGRSYFNEGPSASVMAFGAVYHVDFSVCSIDPIIDRLKQRRVVSSLDRVAARRRRVVK
jgi:hypothetical protein